MVLVKKKLTPKFDSPNDYDDILDDLSQRNVILYDTQTQRGWLIDAERTTLQVILHRIVARLKGYTNVGIQCAETRSDPASVRLAMHKNRDIELRSGFNSTRSESQPVIFHNCVRSILERIEALAEVSEDLIEQSKTEVSRVPHNLGLARPRLIGWEYMDIVKGAPEPRPKEIDPKATCGSWPVLAESVRAMTLFANGFQDVLTPAQSALMCPSFRTLPRDSCLLGVEVSTLRRFTRAKHGAPLQFLGTCMTWMPTAHLFKPCSAPQCSCERIQRLRRSKRGEGKYSGELESEGAIIFGKNPSRAASFLRKLRPSEELEHGYEVEGPARNTNSEVYEDTGIDGLVGDFSHLAVTGESEVNGSSVGTGDVSDAESFLSALEVLEAAYPVDFD